MIAFLLLAAAQLVFDVDTGNRAHYTSSAEPGAAAVVFSNPGKERVDASGKVVISNYFSETLAMPVDLSLAPGAEQRFPIDFSGLKSARVRGIWRATAELAPPAGLTTGTVSFAVIPENGITPRIPRGKYRIGIHYHMGRFPMELQPMLLDCVVALGAKLVRVGGFSADQCWRQSGKEVDFSRTDKYMGLLKARNLAVNVFNWPNPAWMVENKASARRYPESIRAKTRKGLMGEYVTKLCARYRGEIDYLETANEPDFWNGPTMSIGDFVEYQKEVYAAAKAADSSITVLSPGFAQPDSSHPTIKLKGFQERFLVEARDAFDVHAIHGHGTLANYEKQMKERFFPMRERLGVDKRWYANETAATGVNGAEYQVAPIVWRKILWCRAHGATDYIWYNLVATDNDPKSPEQWFGLLSRAFRPRAAFASLAALAHLLRETDYSRTFREDKGTYLYCWKGPKKTVVVGWDDNADSPRIVRLKAPAAHARSVDLMGNEFPLGREGGYFAMQLGKDPSALVFGGNVEVTPNRKDLAVNSVPKNMNRIAKANVAGRNPDFQLMAWWQVQERYAANPETTNRTWRGVKDLSANIYVGRDERNLIVRFDVKDDRLAALDEVWFSVEPPGQRGKRVFGAMLSEKGVPLRPGVVRCDFKVGFADAGLTAEEVKKGFLFQAKVFDDDAVADDCDFWMETRRSWIKIP